MFAIYSNFFSYFLEGNCSGAGGNGWNLWKTKKVEQNSKGSESKKESWQRKQLNKQKLVDTNKVVII